MFTVLIRRVISVVSRRVTTLCLTALISPWISTVNTLLIDKHISVVNQILMAIRILVAMAIKVLMAMAITALNHGVNSVSVW